MLPNQDVSQLHTSLKPTFVGTIFTNLTDMGK
jgi:hypothetical protein